MVLRSPMYPTTSLAIRNGMGWCRGATMHVADQADAFVRLEAMQAMELNQFDTILIRQDPPFDDRYLYNTQILSLPTLTAKVANAPQTLRDYNEKLFGCHFAHLAPPTLVSSCLDDLRAFASEHGDVIIKPLNAMGGYGVLHLRCNDTNTSSALELLTQNATTMIMMQRYIPEVSQGDKRIFVIDGTPVEYCVARVPQAHEARANLAAGGKAVVQRLSKRDSDIAHQVGAITQGQGLHLVGLDVIGDYLTEVNVTSPTGMREVMRETGINVAGMVWDSIVR